MCDKWLSDILLSDGLPESVLEIIKQREGKVQGAALEIVDIVDDWRARAVGGLIFFNCYPGKSWSDSPPGSRGSLWPVTSVMTTVSNGRDGCTFVEQGRIRNTSEETALNKTTLGRNMLI